MPTLAEEKSGLASGFSAAAKAMAAKRMLDGSGRGAGGGGVNGSCWGVGAAAGGE